MTDFACTTRRDRSRNRTPPAAFRARWRASCVSLLALLVGACSSAPKGPPFEPAPPPPDPRARLYVYRIDDRNSLATVHVTIDGQDLGTLRNLEYETIELAAGAHQLRAGMRGFAWLAWGWNEHRFRLTPGETLYIELSVRLAEQPSAGARQIEIAGRESGVASENVFIVRQNAAEASARLIQTTRVAHDEEP